MTPRPPAATRRPHVTVVHGETRVDDYFWLRERENPEVRAYLEAENAYAEASTAHTAALREQIYAELAGRLRESDESAPVRIGDLWYSTRTEAGRQYPVHVRRPALDAPPEVLLDENALAEGHAFLKTAGIRVSPDGRLLSYAVDVSGGEVYDLFVKDLATGAAVDGPVRGVAWMVEWAADSRTLFYVVHTDSWRTYRIYRHTLGAPQAEDTLVYEEADAGLYLGMSRSRDGRYLIVESGSAQTAWASALPLDRPDAAPFPITPRRHGVFYRATHGDGGFFIRTNDAGPGYRVMLAPDDDPSEARWREVVPQPASGSIEAIEPFAGRLAVFERDEALERLRIVELASGEEQTVAFPETVFTLAAWRNRAPWPLNPSHDSDRIRLMYSSLVTPESVYEYDMASRALHVVKRGEVPGYDPSRYVTERLWAAAPDGARVPISLVRRADAPPGVPRPLLLVGYGAYGGAGYEPEFEETWVPLLERGFGCAIAHVRGGADMGEAWYVQGRLLQKMNTFTDFIACAEALIAQGFTAPERLAVRGRSAGGLLIGAVITLRPELFRAAVALVPFVDVINTQLDPTIPLVEQEYEEWGDPRVPEQYAAMRAYSPYDNVSSRPYPALLATAGFNDPRVQYWEPAKWVAKIRAYGADGNGVLLKTELVAGHSGPTGRYEKLRETAFEWAFVLDALEGAGARSTERPDSRR